MSDSDSCKVSRLSELPHQITPPQDGWPALEARLRSERSPQRHGADSPIRPRRATGRHVAVLATLLVALVLGLSVEHYILSPSPAVHHPGPPAPAFHAQGRARPVGSITDPRYLRERATLVRSLDARLTALAPSTRGKVLKSLAVIRRSIHQIQQALARQPGNALLQGLLISTYQDEMQALSVAQDVSGAHTEDQT